VLSCSSIASSGHSILNKCLHVGLQRDTRENNEIAEDEQTAVVENILVVLVGSPAGTDIWATKPPSQPTFAMVVSTRGVFSFYFRGLACRSLYDQANSQESLLNPDRRVINF
jgi:hypothetical protein